MTVESVPMPNNRREDKCPFQPSADLVRLHRQQQLPRVPAANPQLGAFDAVLLTRADDIRQVLADQSCEAGFAFDRDGPRTVMNQPGILLNYDGQEHLRYRRMLVGAFTVRRVRSLTEPIRRIAEKHLDDLAEAGPGADLVETFANPVPLMAVCELLGVPYADRAGIARRSSIGTDVGNSLAEQLENFEAMAAYMGDLVASARRNPGDNILGDLIRRHGAELSDDELVGMGNSILVAGHETVSSMIGLGTLALLRNPDQLAIVRDDDTAADSMVEELLRVLSVAPPLVRQASKAVTVNGQRIEAGEKIIASVLMANHGADLVPEDPDRLDVRRARVAHLAFGYGAHQCIGQHLARLELRIALPMLLRRFPTLDLLGDPDTLSYREDALVFGLTTLPVTW